MVVVGAALPAADKSLGGGREDYQVFPPIRRPLPAAAIRSRLDQDSR
jgi:hypothetical protein